MFLEVEILGSFSDLVVFKPDRLLLFFIAKKSKQKRLEKNTLDGISLQAYLTWHAFFSAPAHKVSLLLFSLLREFVNLLLNRTMAKDVIGTAGKDRLSWVGVIRIPLKK